MPSREYVRLYTSLAISPKWGTLTWPERGVWASLLAYAGLRNDPRFTAEEAAYALRVATSRVRPVLEALVAKGWLDRDGDAYRLHDWHDHQPLYRGPSDDPEAKRGRMAQLRADRSHSSHESHNSHSATEERRGEERRGPPPPARARVQSPSRRW